MATEIPPPPSHDTPPSPDGGSSYSTLSEGASEAEAEASERLRSNSRPAPAGVPVAEPRRQNRTASGEARPPAYGDDTHCNSERESTDSRDWGKDRGRWESVSDNEDEATVRMGDAVSVGPAGDRQRKKKEEELCLSGGSSASDSDGEGGVGWWARSADELLLGGEGDAETNRAVEEKRGTGDSMSTHGMSSDSGKERTSATTEPPLGHRLEVSGGSRRAHRHAPLRRRNTNVSPRDGAVARRPHTWFEAAEGRLASAERGPAQSDSVVTTATGGSSWRHQQGDFDDGPQASGSELHPPRTTAHQSDRVGLSVSWGSTVSSIVRGPSEEVDNDEWENFHDTGTTERRRRVAEAGVQTNSGVSGNNLLQRTYQLPHAQDREGGGVIPPAGHPASTSTANDISARTERTNSARVGGRSWRNTAQVGVGGGDKGPHGPGAPQRPALPAPALRSRDGTTRPDEFVARGYGESVVANKSGRISREDFRVAEGNRSGAWGKGDTETVENVDTTERGRGGGGGSGGRGAEGGTAIAGRGNGDVGPSARSVRWNGQHEEVSPTPAGDCGTSQARRERRRFE